MIEQYFLNYLWLAWKIFITPWQHVDTLWIVLPLILILILIHIYYGRHRTEAEQAQWSAGFGNGISLMWVCVILFRYLLVTHPIKEVWEDTMLFRSFLAVIVLCVWVFVLLLFNFYHILPKRVMAFFSGTDSVYISAYIIVSLVIGNFFIDKHVLIAAIVLFIILVLVFDLIKFVVPKSAVAKRVITTREEKKKRSKAGKKAARTRKFREFIEWVKSKF